MNGVDNCAVLRCVTVRVTVVLPCNIAVFAFKRWCSVTVVTVSVTVTKEAHLASTKLSIGAGNCNSVTVRVLRLLRCISATFPASWRHDRPLGRPVLADLQPLAPIPFAQGVLH